MTPDDAGHPPLDRRPLDGPTLRALPGWQVEVVGEAPSTNGLVSARARSGSAPGLVVVAEHQTAGRGRRDRGWVTPPRAALTFSVLVDPRVPDARWSWLPLLTGLAVAEGLAAAGAPGAVLKWPNDVLYDGRKAAGLLAERVETPSGPRAVLGVGVNVSTGVAELPVESATSLALEGFEVDRTVLLGDVLRRLADRLAAWREQGGDPARGLRGDYEARCATLGCRVRVRRPAGEDVAGVATGVDADGALVVEAAGGPVALSAGDVVHVRGR